MADDAVPTPPDSAADRPPDWFIVFGDDLPPDPLSVETVANHTTLRPGPLQAYRDGEQPFMPWV